MALFNRNKKTTSNYPEEVQEYYQAERRDRTGIAWLLAIGTLIVTILLALLLYFGGRWVYRQLTGGNDDAPGTTQVENGEQDEQEPLPPAPNDDDETDDDEPTLPGELPSDEPVEPRPERTPNTGPRPLPRTGPDGPEV